MGKGHRVGDLHQGLNVFLEGFLRYHRVPRRALNPFHGVEQGTSFALSDVVDRHDIGVFQIAGDDGFRQELAACFRVFRSRGLEHLDGDSSVD